MKQLYMQRFEYRGGPDKVQFDEAWRVAREAMDGSGNWGSVESGITTHGVYLTTWGGYTLFEAATPEALAAYQQFHIEHYAHMVTITFEPVVTP